MLGIKIDYSKRIYGYDLLRAFAIFCVVHSHGNFMLHGTLIEKYPWFNLPHGVDIFFVLSGFLIGYSFIVNTNKNGGKLPLSKTLNFWKRSALRILPNYYLLLAIRYIFMRTGIIEGSTENFGLPLFATFTQNLYYPFYDFFWESWSLAVQEWFYLLFPILLMLGVKIFKAKRAILLIAFLFIIIAIAYRVSINNITYNGFWWDVSFRKVVASRIDSIYFGVIAAWVRFYYPTAWKKYALPSFILGIILFLIVVYNPQAIGTTYTNIFYLTISPIYIVLWFPLIDKLKNVRSKLGEAITHFSVLSYAMYLTNLLLVQIINRHFSDALSNHSTLKYLAYWAATLTFSYLLYIIIENPIATKGNKFFHTTKMMYKRVRENNSSNEK